MQSGTAKNARNRPEGRIIRPACWVRQERSAINIIGSGARRAARLTSAAEENRRSQNKRSRDPDDTEEKRHHPNIAIWPDAFLNSATNPGDNDQNEKHQGDEACDDNRSCLQEIDHSFHRQVCPAQRNVSRNLAGSR
ncbi:hypothetical protein [Rhizobium sp. BR 314]|uniref:hypothetical protein n=1 Tax=Rhizobium sp. BR 314 TaxID=3040013 RepID=UPI0039BFD804